MSASRLGSTVYIFSQPCDEAAVQYERSSDVVILRWTACDRDLGAGAPVRGRIVGCAHLGADGGDSFRRLVCQGAPALAKWPPWRRGLSNSWPIVYRDLCSR